MSQDKKKKFFSSKENKEKNKQPTEIIKPKNIIEQPKEQQNKKPKIRKPKKGEKVVMVQIGVDKYGIPSFKGVPESQVEQFK